MFLLYRCSLLTYMKENWFPLLMVMLYMSLPFNKALQAYFHFKLTVTSQIPCILCILPCKLSVFTTENCDVSEASFVFSFFPCLQFLLSHALTSVFIMLHSTTLKKIEKLSPPVHTSVKEWLIAFLWLYPHSSSQPGIYFY